MNARPVAWWGMVMLIASEATLFGTLIGTYFYLRFTTPHWPPAGIAKPGILVPVVLALVLAASVVPLRLRNRWGVAIALLVQAGYFAYAVHDFADRLRSFTPQTDAYGSIYYVLLGADHAHVFVGLLFDLFLLARLRTGALRVVTVYWLAVAVLTLAVTGTILSAAA
jgi:heme/copper-type cytochrome/quinol oxidase subunit 3